MSQISYYPPRIQSKISFPIISSCQVSIVRKWIAKTENRSDDYEDVILTFKKYFDSEKAAEEFRKTRFFNEVLKSCKEEEERERTGENTRARLRSKSRSQLYQLVLYFEYEDDNYKSMTKKELILVIMEDCQCKADRVKQAWEETFKIPF